MTSPARDPRRMIVIPGAQSPCGMHCEERCEGCKKTCRRWKAFEIAKQMEYAKKRRVWEANYRITAPQKVAEKIHRQHRK